MTSSDLHELTPAYALDALDPEERSAYEAHLPTCERCREELASLTPVTGALAAAASGPAPPPSLRARVLDDVRAERARVVPLASRRRGSTVAATVAAGLAAAVAIGLGVWAAATSSELGDTRAALERERAASTVLADPAARSLVLETGAGRLFVASDGSAVLVLDALDPAPAGRTYQAWVVAGAEPVSAGVFATDDAGPLLVPLDEPVPDGAVVAVTIEREGGAEAPTSAPIAASPPV